MANKITTIVYDNQGNSYQTDVYVTHDANINNQILEGLKIPIILNFYKNQASKEAGFQKFSAIKTVENKEPINSFLKEITVQDAPLVSPLVVQGYVTEFLKGIYGENNVVEI